MGQTPSSEHQQASQQTTGTVINEVEIHQAEVVNKDLKIVLYLLLVTIQLIQLIMVIYKIWCKNLKKKYLKRAQSQELI